MNRHIEILTASATAAAVAGTACTAVGTDSLMLKKCDRANLMACWQTNQTAGFGQLIFPTGHDTTRGYRVNNPAMVNPSLLSFGSQVLVQSQETLAPVIGATAVAGDVELVTYLMRYENSPGMNANLIGPAELDRRAEKYTSIQNSLASTAGPSYGTPETFITDSDLLLPQRDYAILGMTPRSAVHCVYAQTPDAGNVRFGVPGVLRPEITSQWFVLMSRMHSEDLIPVFNSANKGNCFLGVCTDENAGTFVIDLHLALLK